MGVPIWARMDNILHVWNGGAAREKTTPSNPGGQKKENNQKERSERTPHQGIACTMPNTTLAQQKEQKTHETG